MTYKQYRITSANFVLPGETGDADAYIDPTELNQLKKLAGMPVNESDSGPGMVSGLDLQTPQAQEVGIVSPVGTTTNNLAKERKDLSRTYHAMPGTDFWFAINFSTPRDGETLTQCVERYTKAHPECLPKELPGS